MMIVPALANDYCDAMICNYNTEKGSLISMNTDSSDMNETCNDIEIQIHIPVVIITTDI